VFQLLRKNSDRLDVKQDPIITDISLHRSKSRFGSEKSVQSDMK
jgi:hypothetical protein